MLEDAKSNGDRMLSYTFFDKKKCNCTRDDCRKLVEETEKQILWTHGLSFRNPTINKRPIDKQKAMKLLDDSFMDFDEYENHIHINTYSANDMW